MKEIAVCALVSAVSEGDIQSDVTAWFADPADRSAVAGAVDALALLDSGQAAGDSARWHVSLARDAAPPAWWRGGSVCSRQIQVGGRWQTVTVYCCEAQ